MVTCGGQATIPIVHAVSRVVARRLRRDRGHGGLGVGRSGHPARTSTSSPDDHGQGVRGARRRGAGQGHHHPQPGRPAAHHARHHLLLAPGRRRRRQGGPLPSRTWWPRCRPTCPATGCGATRSSTVPDGGRPGRHLPRGRGRRRLPAALLRQPRHHDGRGHEGGRGDRPGARPMQEDALMPYSDTLDVRVTDTSLAGRLPRQAPPVHRGATCARSCGALDDAGMPVIEVTHGDGLGGSSYNYGFSLTDERVLMKAAVDEARQAKIAALDAARPRHQGRHQGLRRPRRVDRADRDALHRGRHRHPALRPGPRARAGDGRVPDDGPQPAARGAGGPGPDHGRRRLPVRRTSSTRPAR